MLFASTDSDNAIYLSCTMILFSLNNQKILFIKMLKSKSDSAECEQDHITIIFKYLYQSEKSLIMLLINFVVFYGISKYAKFLSEYLLIQNRMLTEKQRR